MAEQFLENTDVHTVFEHVRRKTVAQRVAADFFVNSGFLCSPLHRFLQGGFKNFMDLAKTVGKGVTAYSTGGLSGLAGAAAT